MSQFASLTVSAFLDAIGKPEPTPGGGTAAAVAGAIGASLCIMVSGLGKSRTNTDQERLALRDAGASLVNVRDRLMALADADAQAFDRVMAAYRLPKAHDEEKTARTEAIQRALHGATEVPLDVVRGAVDAMEHAVVVARDGQRAASSDTIVGIALLEAAANGAAANVRINLEGLKDEAFRTAATSELRDLLDGISRDAATGRHALSA